MARETIFEEQSVAFGQDTDTVYLGMVENAPELMIGETYAIVWDGTEYEYTAADIDGVVAIGEGETLDPFAISYIPANLIGNGTPLWAIATASTDETHTVAIYKEVEEAVYYTVSSLSLKAIGNAIRAKTENSDALSFPAGMVQAINGITGGGGGSGDYTDAVYTVTFMNGSEFLYARAVADGDNCADVVSRGLVSTPTKASTAQYDYMYNGWSLTDGGSADSAALSNVTEDRTVYAAYSSAVRYYTITYYDSDGVTVLHTESLAYGRTPSYKPTKEDYILAGFEPALSSVTGDASYTAVWDEGLDFSTLSWSEIDAAVKAGKAHYFKLGARKTFSCRASNGSAKSCTAQLVGINHDDLADGSGKAGLTMQVWYSYDSRYWHSTGTTSRLSTTWIDSYAYTGSYIKQLFDEGGFPSDLSTVLKTVVKKHYNHSDGTLVESNVVLFMPSISEFAGSTAPYSQEGTAYEYYADGYANKLGSDNGTWTRTKTGATSGYVYYAKNDGTYESRNQSNSNAPIPNVMLYCCI